MNISRLDEILSFAPLHLILSLNSIWRHSTNPKSWIFNFSERLLNQSLTLDEEQIVISCYCARLLFTSMEPVHHGNLPAWTGRDLRRLFKLIPLLHWKLVAFDTSDLIVNNLLSVFEHFDQFQRSCLRSKTLPSRRKAISAFCDFVIGRRRKIFLS